MGYVLGAVCGTSRPPDSCCHEVSLMVCAHE
jgi:hypothetical protein